LTFEDFERLVGQAESEQPEYDYGTDPPATDEQVTAAEEALGVKLPPEYIQFVKRYGGGEFGLGTVYSVDDGEFNIVERNREYYLPFPGFVAISPNDMGDYWGVECDGGRCSSTVRFLDHETESLAGEDVAEPYDDLFEFLRDTALDFLEDAE
jgi:hypothetical protein